MNLDLSTLVSQFGMKCNHLIMEQWLCQLNWNQEKRKSKYQ